MTKNAYEDLAHFSLNQSEPGRDRNERRKGSSSKSAGTWLKHGVDGGLCLIADF